MISVTEHVASDQTTARSLTREKPTSEEPDLGTGEERTEVRRERETKDLRAAIVVVGVEELLWRLLYLLMFWLWIEDGFESGV